MDEVRCLSDMSKYLFRLFIPIVLTLFGQALAGNVQIPILLDEPDEQVVFVGIPGFTLWQLPSVNPEQQIMSYVIKTGQQGKVIVIDGGMGGGMNGDATALKTFIGNLGNHVHMWFISHQHPDHFNALTTIVNDNSRPTIDKIYGSRLSINVIQAAGDDAQYASDALNFNDAVSNSGVPFEELSVGQVLFIDGISIRILGIKNPELNANLINNSSVVMKLSDGARSILFTGDLGVEGGAKLLSGPYASHLKSDYVQMSHHGQEGVLQDFYNRVAAKYCIWPTTLSIYTGASSSVVRSWVESSDKCGSSASGRHFRSFDATFKKEFGAVVQEIP